MLIHIIANNYVTLFELVGLLVILSISVHISPRQRRYTVTVVALLLLLIVFRETEFYTQSFEKLSLWRPVMTACVYALYPLIMVYLTQLVTEGRLTRKTFTVALIPQSLAAALYLTSQWTHLVFYYSEDNHYQGGPLSNLPYVVFTLYYAASVIFTARSFRKSDRAVKRIMYFILFGGALGALTQFAAGGTADKNDFSLLFATAVVMYYLFININRARVDPLTGLLNRQSYYVDMGSDRITAVASVDMNDLKYYNDYHGHEAGDTALKTVANVMREYCGPGATAYRVGGDEFIILYKNADRRRVEASIAAMEENMKKTEYVCAFGSAMSFEAGNIEELLTLADSRMYKHKAELKKKTRQGAQPQA